ncbi:MAG: hypothetical protein PHN31_03750 [Candidatus Gracilibacteria bacterium]|nr:hypothetical protein [Candidatus Gracilibacteria bacterium]
MQLKEIGENTKNEKNGIDLFSELPLFEAILSNVFKREKDTKEFDILFDDKDERKNFIQENLDLIIYHLNNTEKLNKIIETLKIIFKENGVKSVDEIITKLTNKKFTLIKNGTPLIVFLEDKEGKKLPGYSTEVLQLFEGVKFEIDNIFQGIEIDGIKRDKSYFYNLDSDLNSPYSETNEVLLKAPRNICVTLNNS